MARKYYTLLTRDLSHPVSNQWCIEFGDYDRNIVVAECDEYREQGYRPNELKIITTPDARQATINAVVAAFNKGS